MYTGDSVRCKINGSITRSVFLQRGLRQGCSLSPILFALYIISIGEDLSGAQEGFDIQGTKIAGLLFADDIVLKSPSAEGLRCLFSRVKEHCDDILLEVNTGEGKTEVVSPDEYVWDVLDENGAVTLSLRQVIEYKYLGLETSFSIRRTCLSKQRKCLNNANKVNYLDVTTKLVVC